MPVRHDRADVGRHDLLSDQIHVAPIGNSLGDRPHRVASPHLDERPSTPHVRRSADVGDRHLRRRQQRVVALRGHVLGNDGGWSDRRAGQRRRTGVHRQWKHRDQRGGEASSDRTEPGDAMMTPGRHAVTKLVDHLHDDRVDEDRHADPADDQRSAQEEVDQFR